MNGLVFGIRRSLDRSLQCKPFFNGCFFSSLTLSYLQNQCGLSLESSILASKRVRFDSSENPDKVLNLLRVHGLSHAHIKTLVTRSPGLLMADFESTVKPNLDVFVSLGITSSSLSEMLLKCPRLFEANVKPAVELFRDYGFSDARISALSVKRPILYTYDVERKLKPKLEFFMSLGLAKKEIVTLLSSEPSVLTRSLENHIIPSVAVLRDLLANDEDVRKVIRRYFPILEYNWEKVVVTSASFLVDQGIPESFVWRIFVVCPKLLTLGPAMLGRFVDRVKKLGFHPASYNFMLAIRALTGMSEGRWEEKMNVFRGFNFTEDEILAVIHKQPLCMLLSEKKLTQLLDFFLIKLSAASLLITEKPDILVLSVDKRIVPRCSVLHILKSKDLMSDFSLSYMLRMSEKLFIQRIIKKYQGEAPEIVKAHQGKGEFRGPLTGFRF